MTAQRFCILDYETRSEADLKKIGAYEYARHSSTQILCVAWRIGSREDLISGQAKVWSPAIPSGYGELIKALCDPNVMLVAQNSLFEQLITRYVLSRIIHRSELKTIPISRWICTASLAAALALPRKLEGSGAVLGLSVQKDKEGHRLMLKLSKPRKPTKRDKSKWHSKRSELERLMRYCATDVDTTTELFLRLPPLSAPERKIWELDQKINTRGLYADRALVNRIRSLIAQETGRLNEETAFLTQGRLESTTEVQGLLSYLNEQGVCLPDLTAGTVKDAIETGIVEGTNRRLLEIRQSIAKVSNKKYDAFEARTRTDSRLRDTLVYHQASTGRWTGAGVQVQNFPRGKIKNTELALSIIAKEDLETIRLLYGNPMDTFSSCLRGMIAATPGTEIFCGDYNAIEARVLFWLARHDDGIRAFVEGRKLYEEMAAVIYGKSLLDVTEEEREVGKRAVLGCGYQMGAEKFRSTCKDLFELDVSEEIAQRAVKAYRKTHFPVPRLWGNIQRAAIAATENPGKVYTINRTAWSVKDGFLWCELPSKRKLAFYGPAVRYETKFRKKIPVLYHWGENSLTRKWEESGTYGGRLVENICQAVARDFMAWAMLRLETAGYKVLLTVHDEIVAERAEGRGSVPEFQEIGAWVPAWGHGCPMKFKAWKGPRYKK